MGRSTKSSTIPLLLRRLKKTYGAADCALVHRNAFELLVATILSAQCTDVRVNLVTPALFARYPDAARLAVAEIGDLERLIFSTGFYRNKARALLGTAAQLTEIHAGEVPADLAALLRLPGVARKTANVVLGSFYGLALGVVVDTHVARLSQRLGLTQASQADKIERDLMACIPQRHWIQFSHWLIHHGRQICVARRPRCGDCCLSDQCPSAA